MSCEARFVAALTVGAILLAPQLLAAQGRARPIIIRPPQLKEELRRSVRASGVGVAGLTNGEPRARLSRLEFVISGLAPGERTLCVSLETSSGLYTAQFTLPLALTQPSVRVLLEPRKLPAALRYGQVAVRAQASSRKNCTRAEPLLPVSWMAPNTAKTWLLVNSVNATSVTAGVDGRRARPCQRLRATLDDSLVSVRSFDMICEVPPGECGQTHIVALYRHDGYDVDPPIITRIRGRC